MLYDSFKSNPEINEKLESEQFKCSRTKYKMATYDFRCD